jgi:hypothetical protein
MKIPVLKKYSWIALPVLCLLLTAYCLAACENGTVDSAYTEEEDDDEAVPQRAAVLDSLRLEGVLGSPISASELTLTLSLDSFVRIIAGTKVNDWFAELPDGLTARTKSTVESGGTSLTITISGTPAVYSGKFIKIVIPGKSLSSGEELPAGENPNAVFAIRAPGTAVIPGTETEYTAGGVVFKMITVAIPEGGLTFPVGANDLAPPATITKSYLLAETETTWKLWQTVKLWALDHGYSFDHEDDRGGARGSKLDQTTATDEEPVTLVCWRESVLWLNALTEMINSETGKTRTPVYAVSGGTEVIRAAADDGALDSLYLSPHLGTGFRLPDNMEWELAARWRDDDVNTVPGYSNPYFTKGNSASGAAKAYNAAGTDTLLYAVNDQNWTEPVKSRLPNALGFYDMSGNLYEFCDGENDWNTMDVRVIRGGRWGQNWDGVQVGQQKTDAPGHHGPSMGFRIALSIDDF